LEIEIIFGDEENMAALVELPTFSLLC